MTVRTLTFDAPTGNAAAPQAPQPAATVQEMIDARRAQLQQPAATGPLAGAFDAWRQKPEDAPIEDHELIPLTPHTAWMSREQRHQAWIDQNQAAWAEANRENVPHDDDLESRILASPTSTARDRAAAKNTPFTR